MLHTTFALCKKHSACADRYQHLADALGGVAKYGADTPIPLSAILEHNGFDDALWALRAVPEEQSAERDRLARLFACWCAEQVLHIFENQYPKDKRPRNAIDVARRFALGEADITELTVAWEDASAAARTAWDVASVAARAAASVAASAASVAARAAARAAASAAAWDVASVAASAASVAGRAAARVAASVAASAASVAASDAWVAASDAQAVKLKEMFLTDSLMESAGRR